MPTIAMVIVGMSFYYAWDYARLTKTYDFRGYVNGFYSPFEKTFATLVDAFFLITVCMPVGTSIAGGGSLIETIFGVPNVIGCTITALVFLVLSIYGAGLIRKVSLSLSTVIMFCLGTIAIVGFIQRGDIIADIVRNRTMMPGESYGTALWGAILYASFQSNNAPMIAAADQMKTKQDVILTTAIGIIVNSVMLTIMCIVALGWLPDIIKVPIANLKIASDLGSGFLYVFYCVALYAAYITTAVTFLYAVGKRFENSFFFKNVKETSIFARKPETKIRVSIAVAVLYGFLASFIGLTTLVNKGYTYLGYIYIPLVLIPQLVVGPIKCRRLEKLRAEQMAVSERE